MTAGPVSHDAVDTEMYLRDGFPHAVVCKVQLKDGRIGIGIFRQDPEAQGSLGLQAADKAALDDALENIPAKRALFVSSMAETEPEDDLQQTLGDAARD